MLIDLYEGEVELRRVKESEIGWVTEQVVSYGEIVEIARRDLPVEPGQRWVLDPVGSWKPGGDHGLDEWVLIGPEK